MNSSQYFKSREVNVEDTTKWVSAIEITAYDFICKKAFIIIHWLKLNFWSHDNLLGIVIFVNFFGCVSQCGESMLSAYQVQTVHQPH
jgi:hypothetical protein